MSDTKAASAADKPRTGQPKAAGFSYAKAAQGRQTAAAQKPTAANQQAGANTNGGKAVAASAASTTSSGAATPAIKEAPAAPALASVSTTDASSPKNTEKSSTPVVSTGSNVHMPPRAQEPSTSAVQFGNFANQGQQQAQESPVPSKAQPVANPGPRTGPNKMPQFGSFENGNENKQLHSRTNSESSEFRPTNVPNFNGQNPGQGGYYGQGQPAFGYQPGYAPAMPGYRGPQRGGMQQFSAPRGHHTPGRPSQGSGNHASMASPRGNSVSSPLGTPQQQHAQMAQMNSPMGSPMYNGYTQMHAPGMYGYPGGYSPAFGQGGYPGYPGSPMQGPGTPGQGGSYINQQGRQMQYGGPQVSHGQGQGQASQGGNQYQNPNLQSPAARGSGLSDRTNSTPQPPATPTFKTPRKSAAIKIVRPDTKEEVVVPRVETRRAVPAATASPAPSSRTADRPLSSAASIGSSSTPAPATVSTPVPETPEQIKAKQDAARQAVFDKLAASRAQSEEAAAAAKKKETDAADAEQKAAEEKEKAEKEVAEKEAAEKAAAEKAAAEKAAADKAAEEQRLKAEEEAKQKVEAEAAANKAKEEAEAKAEEAQQKAAAEEAESGKAESEAAEKTKVGELSSAQSGSLDTIAEPAAEDQKADIVETKPLEDDMKKLSIDTSAKDAPSRMLECLEKAKSIASLKDISYPSGINPPSTTLNANASNGKFKYDRDFLLQFQKVYTDKPMQNWDERIKETIGDADSRSAKGGLGGRNGSRGPQSPFTPLPFSSGKPLPTSQARFDQAEKMRAQGLDPKTGLPSASRRGPEVNLGAARDLNLPRTDSKRGGKSATGGRAPSNRPEKNREGAPTIAPEDVKPLPKTKNAWVPKRGAAEQEPLPGGEDTQMPPEMVQRKVKGLLNKLTVDNFERITDQILEISSQSKNETDGRTLRQVIALTFEKATDEAHFSNMYARFCRKMMDTMDPSIGDESLKNGKGETVTGGVLFRKYLLTRCQEDFERGWKSQLPPKPEGEAQTEEAAMLSDEYYIEAAAKRRGLGLVRFVGEVYKLGMLNEKIMHQIIVKLLSNVKDPEEDEVESMTKLITTVGATFDAQERGSQYMDAYVVRMKDMAQNTKLSSRHRFMIMDVLDLRAAGWQGADTAGPKTIQAIHEEAEKAAALKEAQRGPSHRGGPPGGGGRPGFGHGDVRAGSRRQESHGPTITTSADGWSSVRAAGDLGAFGKFDRTGSKQSGFGPGGSLSQQARNTISGRSAGGSRNPSHAGNAREDSRAAPQQPANAFAVLQGDDGEPKEEEESGVATEQAEATGRPKLNILPKGATSGEEAEASPAADSGARRPLLNLLPKGATSGKEPVMAPKSSQEESPAGEAEASSNKPDADNEDD